MLVLRIKELLKEKRCTGKELAERIGINRVTMVNIINGKSNPSFDTIVKIADALDVPLWQLFASKEDATADNFIAFFHHKGSSHTPTTMDEMLDILKAWKEDEFHEKCQERNFSHIRDTHRENMEIQRLMDALCALLGFCNKNNQL